jgi:hypothetical protein
VVEEGEVSDVKLTKAQREWLERLAHPVLQDHEREAHVDYAPTTFLHAKGLVDRHAVSMYRGRFLINDAGRAWLAAHPRRAK